jgi:hypothetical protein
LLGSKGQYVLWIDDPRTSRLQTNSDAIMPSYDDLALPIKGNSARTTGDFDLFTHGQYRVTSYTDRHNQARGDGSQDSRRGGMYL